MKAVSQRKVLYPSIENSSLFPDVPIEKEEVEEKKMYLWESKKNAIFPDIGKPSLSEQYSVSETKVESKQEKPRLLAEISHDDLRYQSIIFNHGFYLLDREKGEAWFLKAGTEKFVPCTFSFPQERQIKALVDPPFSPPFDSPSPLDLLNSFPLQLAPISFEEMEKTMEDAFSPPKRPKLTFEDEIISSYPYPIAKLYQSYITEENTRRKIELLMLLYLQIIKWMAMPLLLRFLKDSTFDSISMYRALCHLQSSRWSDWLSFLHEGVKFFQNSEEALIKEIVLSFSRLELNRPLEKCFMHTQHFLDPEGEEKITQHSTGHWRHSASFVILLYMDLRQVKERPSFISKLMLLYLMIR